MTNKWKRKRVDLVWNLYCMKFLSFYFGCLDEKRSCTIPPFWTKLVILYIMILLGVRNTKKIVQTFFLISLFSKIFWNLQLHQGDKKHAFNTRLFVWWWGKKCYFLFIGCILFKYDNSFKCDDVGPPFGWLVTNKFEEVR